MAEHPVLPRRREPARASFLLGVLLLGFATVQPAGSEAALRPRHIPAKPARSEVPPGYDPAHIEVKFRDDLEPYLGGARIPRERGHGLQSERAQRLFRDLQSVGADWSKAVTLDEARVNAMRLRAERSLGRAIADFNDYFILTLPAGAEAGRWLDELNALPEVELATPLPLPVPAPLAEDFTPLQGYLTPATAGTDATYAWTIPGGTGAGVTICDVESNWNLNHLDLPPVSVFLPPGTISTPTDDPDGHHGTAVLGEMGSLPNGWGTTGASYGAAFAAVPVRLNNQYQVPLALLEAITHLVPGDVILIEQQITGPEGVGLAPVEWNQASYYAVLTAVGNGIHVVEAAGNGSMDLDAPLFQTAHAPFLPENESGAIMVGAGASPPNGFGPDDRSKLGFSNYGSRVNVQGWGHNVTTTGYGGLYFAEGMNLLYTNGFNGTSSASPIVASAVASIEGIVEAETGLPAHPALVRALLERTGSPQQSGAFPVAQYHIGPRPDLRAATQRRGIPIVVARDAVVTKEEVPLDLRIHAGDLDGEPIQSLLASPLPSGATYTVGQDALTATLEWTPSRGQAGVYTIVFTASNGTSASDTTVITVESIELPPAIAAPASESGMEGEPQTIPVSTSDPNGDPIVSFTATGLPAGASFVLDATGTSGSLVWTPDFMQAGVHLITLEATSIPLAPPGSAPVTTTATVSWSITNVDRPPNLSVPINLAGAEGVPLTLSVTAVDPDGDSLQSLTAQGLPQGASFESSPDFSSGTLSWLPGFDQSGTYSVQFRCSNALEATVTTTLHIAHVDRPPVITVPTNVHGVEGVRIEFDVFATDPDGDPIVAFESAGLPPGSQFLPVTGLSSAHFDWVPDFGQAGNYEIFLSATSADRALPVSGTMSTSTATLGISVASGNRPPVSDAGGPYFGLASIGIFLDGTGSSDPDGDPLTYDWDFGDGTTGTGPQPLHAFPAGQFTVALTVQDGTLSDRDETSATIQAVLEARTYLFGGGGALRLGSGKPTTCVQIEPVGGTFEADEIDPSSVSMRSAGTGSVDHIVAIANKTTTGEDRDRNGIPEVTACFAKEDLRRLFDGLPAGRNLVPVTLTGALTRGGEFRGTLNLTVIQSGGISASISPNPTAGKAVLTFRTAVPGRAKVSLFGVSGRLVGTLLDGTLPAGYHDVPIGDDRSGQRLGAGIYFYRIEAGAEVLTGRFSVVR